MYSFVSSCFKALFETYLATSNSVKTFSCVFFKYVFSEFYIKPTGAIQRLSLNFKPGIINRGNNTRKSYFTIVVYIAIVYYCLSLRT